MAAAVEKIKISLEFSDSGAAAVVKKLESSFRGLTNAANQLDTKGISQVRDRIKSFDTAGRRNINTIQSQISALTALRNEARVGSKQFKQLTADISRYSRELQKAEGRKRSGGRLVGAAKSVGAVAAAGVFGGPEGAIGAGIGAALGGPVGAAVGGAIGAELGQLRQALGATAEYAATLTKLRIALKGVTDSQAEYQEGLSFIQQTTKDFAVPQEVVTRQFTKLQASVSGAGGNLDDTKKAFNGIIAAVRATGGSLADVDSALTATSQVFSKGKVSAEELRQQLGERLPGAFTLFAESVGMTPQELDKALEGGKVTLQDFQVFAEKLFEKYGETAKTIADSPEAAGDRLKVALDSLSENVGELLKPIGASFQETFINIVEFIDMATGRLKLFLELGATGTKKKVDRLSADITRLLQKQEAFNRADRAAGRSVIRPSDRRMVEHQLGQKREQLQAAQATLRDLTGFNVVAEAPGRKKGLPGSGGLPTKPAKDITKAQADAQIAQLALRERGITLTKEQIEQAAELARKAAEALPPQKQRVELKSIEIKAANQINQLEQKQLRRANSVSKAKIELNKLLTKAKGESGMFTDEQLKQAENQIKLNELMLKFNILVEDGVLSAEELEEKLRKALEALNKPGKEGMEKFKEQFKKGLDSMADVAATNAVQGLGDKIHEVVTTGKADFKEFARSVLSDISKIMIQAAIAGAVKKAFNLSAKGNAFAGSGVVPFAKGGIVSKPTVFQYADGASGSFGLMGEAGAEAIMPLKRGPSGRLGVEVANQGSARDAMNRYSRRSAGAAGGGLASEDEAIAAVQGSSAAIDVRYSVERINNVDYVTADQFQQGLQQAAAQGAQRGEQQTLRRLQMSSSTRRRIGV
jgi:lambda family phage tail tape measure protein